MDGAEVLAAMGLPFEPDEVISIRVTRRLTEDDEAVVVTGSGTHDLVRTARGWMTRPERARLRRRGELTF